MSPMYEFSVPVFIKGLYGLKTVIEKAQAHGVDESVLMGETLAPDMYPFVRQVQIACDNAKGAVARLAGSDIPSYPDTEATFAELIARIEKTIAYVESITPDMLQGSESSQITLPYFPNMYMTGYDYLREYVLANFYFHVTTAYALIRKQGVSIGKTDYMHSLPLKPLTA